MIWPITGPNLGGLGLAQPKTQFWRVFSKPSLTGFGNNELILYFPSESILRILLFVSPDLRNQVANLASFKCLRVYLALLYVTLTTVMTAPPPPQCLFPPPSFSSGAPGGLLLKDLMCFFTCSPLPPFQDSVCSSVPPLPPPKPHLYHLQSFWHGGVIVIIDISIVSVSNDGIALLPSVYQFGSSILRILLCVRM